MTTINIGKNKDSIVIGGSVNQSNVALKQKANLEIFDEINRAIQTIDNPETRQALTNATSELKNAVGTPSFVDQYKAFMEATKAHVTLFSPFLSGLAKLLA